MTNTLEDMARQQLARIDADMASEFERLVRVGLSPEEAYSQSQHRYQKARQQVEGILFEIELNKTIPATAFTRQQAEILGLRDGDEPG